MTTPIRIVSGSVVTDELGKAVPVKPIRYVEQPNTTDEMGRPVSALSVEIATDPVVMMTDGRTVATIPARVVDGTTTTNEVGRRVAVVPVWLDTTDPVDPIVNVALPTITGTAEVGETLTGHVGTWSNNPTSYSYQWRRGGGNIAGANALTFGVTGGEVGHVIEFVVTASKAGTPLVSAMSAATSIVPDPASEPEPPVYARAASTNTTRVAHSGHSLTDAYVHYGPWPGNFRAILVSQGINEGDDGKQVKAVIPGSSIQHRYEDDAIAFPVGERPYTDVASLQSLVITESGPPPHVNNAAGSLNMYDYCARFVANQIERGSGLDVVLWTIWPDLRGPGYGENPGPDWGALTFRTALPEYERAYKRMADFLTWKMHQLYPMLPDDWRIWISPGNRWMARVYDDMALGLVPGFTTIDELFDDFIHTNTTGVYGLACLNVTLLYQVNLTTAENVYIMPAHTQETGEGPLARPAVTQAQAEYFWRIAWEIATAYEPAGMGGTEGAGAEWSLDVDGDLMPQWRLDDPNTDPLPEPEPEPELPTDILAQITPTTITGLTFSPDLPAAVGEYRTLTAQYQSPLAGAVYMAVRGRRATGGPIFASLGTTHQNWNADKLTAAGHGGYGEWIAARESPNELTIRSGVEMTTDYATLEVWYAGGSIHISVDGSPVVSEASPAYAAFTTLYLNLYEGGYDLVGFIPMARIPTAGERAGIRVALEEV